MLVVRVTKFTRDTVFHSPHLTYLFGDNIEDAKSGYVPGYTQAVIRGMPNAVGICTKKNRFENEDSYLSDDDFDWFKDHVDGIFEDLYKNQKDIAISVDGIGTGKAKLAEKAPKLFEYLNYVISWYEYRLPLFNDKQDITEKQLEFISKFKDITEEDQFYHRYLEPDYLRKYNDQYLLFVFLDSGDYGSRTNNITREIIVYLSPNDFEFELTLEDLLKNEEKVYIREIDEDTSEVIHYSVMKDELPFEYKTILRTSTPLKNLKQ